MQLDVQDWLIVLGALLIVGVLLDAYRRYRNERRNPIRMSRFTLGPGDGFAGRDESEASSAELPLGSARVITRELSEPAPARPARARAERVEPSLGPQSPSARPAAKPKPARTPAVSAGAEVPVAAPADEVVVIRVFARGEGGFGGAEMMRIFKECDVRFGERRIFHRHEESKGRGAVQFSVVNAVEPGIFDQDAMDGFTTPGLGFFMRLPGPQKPLEAFDCMLETARAIAKYLDGEMRDESGSVFTQQTGEHCRQRIREYALRARAARR